MNTDWAGTPREMREALEAASGLPVECAMIPDKSGVIATFTVLQGPRPWRKPFIIDTGRAVPTAFLAMLQSWRVEMVKALLSPKDENRVLHAVVREFGEERVKSVLNEKLRTIH